MRSKRLKQVSAAILATIVTLSGALVLASPQSVSAADDRRESPSKTLEGTWWVKVTALTDCASRAPLMSFSALLTFAKGGTMTGATANPAFAIGQRGPDHGVWSWDRAAHSYRASSIALLLFTTAPHFPVTPGFQAGSQRLDQTIDVTDPDRFTSDAVTEFFDVSGDKYREACATAVGQRFE